MKAIPVFVLLFGIALAVIQVPKNEPTLATPQRSADCDCKVCNCVDCTCGTEKPLVSVVKPAVDRLIAVDKPAGDGKPRLVADLGYGHPPTQAPLVTEIALNRPNKPVAGALKAVTKPILSAAEAIRARELLNRNRIDRDHQAPKVEQSQPAIYRPFLGTVCMNGVCQPQYGNERVDYPDYQGYYERINGQWVWFRNRAAYQPRRAFLRRW